jgi:hypothetical protein
MSFSYDASLGDDVSLVRFHVGDKESDGYFLEDEEIQYFVTNGSVGEAVIKSIKYIISQLSKPDFRKDWLAVSNMAQARKGYQELLAQKASEFGLPLYTAVSTISHPYRADSAQDSDEWEYDGTTE